MTTSSIAPTPFSEIPGFPNLYLDYISEFENVSEYFKTNFRDASSYENLFKKISSKPGAVQQQVEKIIIRQYSKYLPSEITQKNISLLGKPNTLSIITGQQLGILGGPLYTIYKIITAIKLAESIKKKHPAYNFVPVFWMETEDHDFEEIRHTSIVDDKSEIKKISYEQVAESEDDPMSTGTIKISGVINDFFEQFEASIRKTDFTADILDQLKRFYTEGRTFKDAFRDLLFYLFDNYGLIVFDPQDIAVKALLKDVFVKEITDYRAHTSKLIERSAKLEEIYHAQVKVKPVNLFFMHEEKRYAILPDETGGFKLRRKRIKFTTEELLLLAENHPEKFSPNVLLRPICQDTLFNTAAYVAGPSEVSYFAQVMPLYDFFNIPAPIIYPRSSATLMEKHNIDFLNKSNIRFKDLFLKQDSLLELAIANVMPFNFNTHFTDAEAEIISTMSKLRDNLSIIDKTTGDSSEKYKVKMISALAEYKAKALVAEKAKHEVLIKKTQKILNTIYPNGNLQERVFNFFGYANRYGLELISKIYDSLDETNISHQIIEL